MARPFSDMPSAGNLISNTLQLTSIDFHRKVYALAATHGGIFKMKAPINKTIVVITDPAILEGLAAGEFTDVTKPPDVYNTFAVVCSSSQPPTFPVLATDDENKWEAIRGGFAQAFAKETVPQYLPVLIEEASAVLDRLVGPRQLDVMQVAGRINLSTTGRIMFGYDFACRDVDVPCKFWQDVVASRTGAVGAARSPLIKLEQRVCPCQPGPKEYRAGLKGLHEKYEEIYSVLEDAAAHPHSAAEPATPVQRAFQTTPDYRYPQDLLSKEDAIATIGNLVVAGTFPASTAAAYTLALIACSPDVQKKVHEELDSLGLGKRPFEAADMPKLRYLNNVIKEAMRVNPAVPQINRATAKDVVIGGYKVPKGTLLFLSIGGMHTSPYNFTEPHRFWPERWEVAASKLEAGSDSKHPKATCQGNIDDVLGSFKPFSQGSRECLGQHWARLAIAGTLVSVLARFTLTSPRTLTVDSLAATETLQISTYPSSPLLITFTPRGASN